MHMKLLFEWDLQKAKINLLKHHISFDEASSSFEDNLSITIFDPLHSEIEDRFILIGVSSFGRLLVVVHTDRGENIRIISARLATLKEKKQYEKNEK